VTGKSTLACQVSQNRYDEVDDYADENGFNKSQVLRRALIEYFREDDETGAGRAVSPLALLGVICLAVAPTLLATGHVLVGALAGLVAAAWVLLWVTATDVLVEEALGTAREELQAVGGVRGFFRAVIYEDRVVDDPETLVERLTYADVAGAGLLTVVLLLGLPLLVAARLGLLGPTLEAIGSAGVLALLVGAGAVAYGGALLLAVSALATLAVASARHDLAADDPADA